MYSEMLTKMCNKIVLRFRALSEKSAKISQEVTFCRTLYLCIKDTDNKIYVILNEINLINLSV